MRLPLHPAMRTKVLALLCVVCVCALYLARAENGSVRILRPLDKSVVGPGPVEIAVIVSPSGGLPTVVLDGEKLRLSGPPGGPDKNAAKSGALAHGVFEPPAFVLVRRLSPGIHELRAGDAGVKFFVCDEEGKNVPLKDWLRYIAHPPADEKTVSCVGCHELAKDGRFTNMTSAFSMEKPTRCFECHNPNELSLTHRHRLDPLAFCQMCHEPHGSAAEHILKMPAEKACTLCHD